MSKREKYSNRLVCGSYEPIKQEISCSDHFDRCCSLDVEDIIYFLNKAIEEIKEDGWERLEMWESDNITYYKVYRKETDKECRERLLSYSIKEKERKDAIEANEREQLKRLRGKYKE